MKKSRYEYPVPEYQADATLNQVNPTSGLKYTVLDATPLCRLITVQASITWTVQGNLEFHVTVDGVPVTTLVATPASTEKQYLQLAGSGADWMIENSDKNQYRPYLIEGRTIKVEVETTGGTVSNLSARVKYARW